MAKRDKICDENIFGDSQISGQTSDLAFALRLLATDKGQTISVKVQNFTFQNKYINRELLYVGFRHAEQLQGVRIRGDKPAVNVGHNNGIGGVCQ
jgi:hypothetical protein